LRQSSQFEYKKLELMIINSIKKAVYLPLIKTEMEGGCWMMYYYGWTKPLGGPLRSEKRM